jgi:glutamine synthetase adenylyltransferase
MKRRSFLSGSTAAAFGFQFVPAHVVRAQGAQNTPGNKIRLAVIGCGGRGAANLGDMSGEDIVALCDVDERSAAESFDKFPRAKRFKDFRRMFDAMAGEIHSGPHARRRRAGGDRPRQARLL